LRYHLGHSVKRSRIVRVGIQHFLQDGPGFAETPLADEIIGKKYLPGDRTQRRFVG
jgi:hypothetical protein